MPSAAAELAELAYEFYIDCHGGVWPVRDLGCLCYFNNRLYLDDYFEDADPALRDGKVAALRESMFEILRPELAYATYPNKDPYPDGSSFAMLIAANPNNSADRQKVEILVRECGLPIGTGSVRLGLPGAEQVHVL